MEKLKEIMTASEMVLFIRGTDKRAGNEHYMSLSEEEQKACLDAFEKAKIEVFAEIKEAVTPDFVRVITALPDITKNEFYGKLNALDDPKMSEDERKLINDWFDLSGATWKDVKHIVSVFGMTSVPHIANAIIDFCKDTKASEHMIREAAIVSSQHLFSQIMDEALKQVGRGEEFEMAFISAIAAMSTIAKIQVERHGDNLAEMLKTKEEKAKEEKEQDEEGESFSM